METEFTRKGEWRIAERWSASAGLRVTRVSVSFADHFIVTGNGDDSGDLRFRATAPVAGLLFRALPNLNRDSATGGRTSYKNASRTGRKPRGMAVGRDGRIRHAYATELLRAPGDKGQGPRHVDSIWPLWNVFDFTPEGRGTSRYPKLDYAA